MAVAAGEGRVSFGRFGPDGSEETRFNPPFKQAFSIGALAFDQEDGDLVALVKGEGGCIERFHVPIAPPAVPLPAACDPAMKLSSDEFGSTVAVDNSGGAGQGTIYVGARNQAGDARVFAFGQDGAALGAPFPLSVNGAATFAFPAVGVSPSGDLWVSESEEPTAGNFDFSIREKVVGGVEIETERLARNLAFDSEEDLFALFGNGEVRKYEAPGYTESEPVDPTNAGFATAIAVDGNHLLVARQHGGAPTLNEARWISEYDSSGKEISPGSPTFLEVPKNEESNVQFPGIAIDESNGITYVAEQGFGYVYTVSRFGVHPDATTGVATEVTTGGARFHGVVNPNGKATTCEFEWGSEAEWVGKRALSHVATCKESPGSGTAGVPVDAAITGLQPSSSYYYRLDARNAGGVGPPGDVQSFTTAGPPTITASALDQATGTTATVSARIRSVEAATYWVEYGAETSYGQSVPVPVGKIKGGQGAEAVAVEISGLAPGSLHHARFVAENGAGATPGPDIPLGTYPAPASMPACPNAVLRTGFSAALPDCRAYELVTPNTHGQPVGEGTLGGDTRADGFATELGSPDGNNVLFSPSAGTLPGEDGNGLHDRYEVIRGGTGWTSRRVTPSRAEADDLLLGGASPDHGYAFYVATGGSLGFGQNQDASYLRHPDGALTLLGEGDPGLESDLHAKGKWIAAGGTHVIFTARAKLTADAPGGGGEAVYDRTPTGLHLLSPAGEVAKYAGVSADGGTVAFEVGSTLYVALPGGEEVAVAGGATFAGLSRDGSRLFYLKNKDLFVVETGGEEKTTSVTTGAADPLPVNISADGSHAYFLSKKQLDGEAGEAGAENLYVGDGEGVTFIATVSASDVSRKPSIRTIGLGQWLTGAVAPDQTLDVGPANETSRTNHDGSILLFEAAAPLTLYDNSDPLTEELHSEIYRYDASSGALDCISCSPIGAAARSDARLQSLQQAAPTSSSVKVNNLSENGRRAFFETGDALVAADVDHASDIYEWEADGEGACTREEVAGGCIYLISSGQSPADSGVSVGNFLYSATPDGHDVFIRSNDSLVPGMGEGGEQAIYDVRVEGGFAAATEPTACQGEACRPALTPVPSLGQSVSETGSADGGKAKRSHRKSHRGKHRGRGRHHHKGKASR